MFFASWISWFATFWNRKISNPIMKEWTEFPNMEVLFFQGDGRLLVQGGVKRPTYRKHNKHNTI